MQQDSKSSVLYPLLRPLLPTADRLLPYLQRIDESRWYTNYGPLVQEFESLLARHFHVQNKQLTTVTNATLAITQTLKALDVAEGSVCVMPSWTFVATPAAAQWAGLPPYFIDVDAHTWIISPEAVLEVAKTQKVGAVVLVSAFGAPIDLDPWEDFVRQSGIPVIVDAAAGFDGFRDFGLLKASSIPVIISLHATKVSGIGEGAVVLCKDEALLARIQAFGNFGFHGDRQASVAGANTKMSEYTAAVGLAFIAEWPERRREWLEITQAFALELQKTPEVAGAPGFNGGWISSYGMVELPEWISGDDMISLLRREGIESRQWWAKGCHQEKAYRFCEKGSLDVTNRLGRRVIGLPFWRGMESEDITTIFSVLRNKISRHGCS